MIPQRGNEGEWVLEARNLECSHVGKLGMIGYRSRQKHALTRVDGR